MKIRMHIANEDQHNKAQQYFWKEKKGLKL